MSSILTTATLQVRVLEVRPLTEATYVLRLERQGVAFRAGQSITLGVSRMRVNREYTIYSGEQDDYIDVLIREIQGGTVSVALRRCPPGELLECNGPFGSFVIPEPSDRLRKYLFIASGTGIAPYHSMVRTHPELDYRIIHGIRNAREQYDLADYDHARYVACVTGEPGGDFSGRVTAYLHQHPVDPGSHCYLCGNGRMLTAGYELLREQGVPSDQIHLEAFF